MDKLSWLLVINTGALVTIVTLAYRVIRFINTIEFKTDLMWRDYEYRMKYGRREGDHYEQVSTSR